MAPEKDSAAPEKDSAALSTVRGVLRSILPAAAGSFIEWYEFAIFGYLSSYITANFFAGGRGGSLSTWAGFAVTFAFRPLGGLAFGLVADQFGRKPAMQLSICCMLASTVAQGLLPSFACCGETWGWVGLVAMLVCRALQGLSAGGELSTAAVYVAEVSPLQRLGFNMSWIAVSGAFGAYVVAALVVLALECVLDPAEMSSWGWRLAYGSSIVPGVAVILGRRLLEETLDSAKRAEMEEGNATEAEAAASPLREILANHKATLVVGFLGTAGIGALWYVPPVYGVQLVRESAGLPTRVGTLSEVLVFLVPTLLSPSVGQLVDRWGAGRVHLLTLFLGCLAAPPPLFCWWRRAPSAMSLYLGQLALGLLLALTSSVYLWTVELFPARVRVTGVSLAYNLGIGVFGGLGPLACDAGGRLIGPRGALSAPSLYVVCVGLVSVLTVVASRVMSRRGAIKLAHLRASPY